MMLVSHWWVLQLFWDEWVEVVYAAEKVLVSQDTALEWISLVVKSVCF